MDSVEKRKTINSITRWIAYTVYPRSGDRAKFTRAYDKLAAKVLIDHNFSIRKLVNSHENKATSMFDVLHDDELEKVLVSARSLQDMYNDVLNNDYM